MNPPHTDADFRRQCRCVACGHYSRMPLHRMQRANPMDYLIIWVQAGAGVVETEGTRLEVQTGRLISLRPRRAHAYGSDARQPWDILWAHFTGALAAPLVRTIRQFGGIAVTLGADAALRDRWEELVLVHNGGGPGVELRANTAMAALLGQLVHRLQSAVLTPERAGPLDAAAWRRRIQSGYREPLTLTLLAREARLSPTHFARVFKQQLGVSPVRMVIDQRLAVARDLLAGGTMPVKQIAAAVGYDDPYYFSRLFRRHGGRSPARFRREARDRDRGPQLQVGAGG